MLSPADTQGVTLLRTKLHIPPRKLKLVLRPRLIEKLNAGLNHKLTLVSAPAGFGKTTLLSEWIRQVGQPTAWLSLDPGDNDPHRFWRYVTAALQTVDATVGQMVLGALESPPYPPLDAIVTALINELIEVPTPLVIVLDDYHAVEAELVHATMNSLLDHLPPQLHVVIATREDPPLSVSRRRGRSELIEVRTADLCFTIDEATDFLNTCMDLNLPAEDIAALTGRTEGWIVGLQMSALSMTGLTPSEKHGFIAAFTGDDRYIGDYLVEEVLRHQPSHIRSFLLRTSILERLSGSLCGAVTGRDDSQVILAALEQSNLFVFPLDNQRHWYRYHHLFADLLCRRLHDTTDVPDIRRLHLRASEWYEHEGFIAEAVSHALDTSDPQYAAAFIKRHAPTMLDRSETLLALHWLQALPEELIRACPFLCLSRAWSELYHPSRSMKDSAECAEQWVQDAETAWDARLRDQDEPDTIDRATQNRFSGNVAALRARLSWRRGEPAPKTIELVNQALHVIPEEDLHLRSIVLYVLGSALLDETAAIQPLIEARRAGEASGNLRIALLATCIQACYIASQGQLQHAAAICREALRSIAEPFEKAGRPLPIAGAVYIALGGVLQEWNDLEESERALSKGMALIKLVGYIGPSIRRWGLEALVRLKMHQGDIAGALDLIEQMDHVEPGDASFAAMLRARLWLWQAERDPRCLAAATRWADEQQLKLDRCGWRDGERLTLARLFIAQRRANRSVSKSPSAQTQPDLQPLLRWLDEQLQAAQKANKLQWMIEVLILRAMALEAQDETNAALSALQRALALAEPSGFVLLFVDEGTPMARLLYKAAELRISPEYTGKLLAAFGHVESPQPLPALRPEADSPSVEPLTEREFQVLQLIAEGLSNREIAQQLFLSPHTVRIHASNIYSKLGVGNRTQAVARASRLGILPQRTGLNQPLLNAAQ